MTTSIDIKVSPMMAQWHACKAKANGALLLFRLGDFYEAFHEDAILIAKELELTLTKRQEIPMAGVPFHASDSYIDKLVGKGYRVAIAEQMEDPKMVKGIVKREIVRIVTPGTLVTSSLLTEKTHNYLCALTQLNTCFGLSILDLTTSDFKVLELEDKKQLLDELFRLKPSELLISEKCNKNLSGIEQELQGAFTCVITPREEWHFDHRGSIELLLNHFQLHSLDGFGLKGMVAGINAAGALLSYVKDELSLPTEHIRQIKTEQISAFMALDRATIRHLELWESLHDSQRQHTLLTLLDRTATPMGGRLLKDWLIHPLLSCEMISNRQDVIAEMLEKEDVTLELYKNLNEVRDLERLIMRIATGYATARDLVALRFSLEQVPLLKDLLSHFTAKLLVQDRENLSDVGMIASLIKSAIVEEPPFRLTDGNIIREGYHHDLDELRSLKSDSQSWMARYQTQLKESTNIKTLKIGYTKAFGYYIEVSRGQSTKMPENFERRQTLVNAERFITPELKSYEHKMLSAEERIASIELKLFNEVRTEVSKHFEPIREIAKAIAQIDCLLSLALVAKTHGYIRPNIDNGDIFHVEAGRHPVIEATLLKESFIPNDVLLDNKENRLMLITGPNMAGKSTYIRQVALFAILAQMGSFIPAKKAHLGIIDKVFSRIGASDDLSRGQSTFMVEMTETANILNNATPKSLVILDEIGRGTSTYDGISIAWAVAEYLLTNKEKTAKTLFATHYWELTELEEKIPGAVNFNVAVHESERGIIFLRKIIKGSTDKSYGIHVAKLAGLPQPVIKRAQEMLKELEKTEKKPSSKKSIKQEQLDLFSINPADEKAQAFVEELKKLDPNRLTPLDALQKITEWIARF